MSSGESPRDDADAVAPPNLEMNVNVDAVAAEETPAPEADTGGTTEAPQVPTEASDSSQAAASSDMVVEKEAQDPVAITQDTPPQTNSLKETVPQAVDNVAPPAAEPKRKPKKLTASPEAAASLRKPSPSPDSLRKQERAQQPNVVARAATPASPSIAPSVNVAHAEHGHQMTELERIAIAAASLTPTTTLAVFRRGHENSHVNRMDIGSYSRYLLSTDYMTPLVFHDTFFGHEPTIGSVPRNTVEGSGRGNLNKSATENITARAATSASSARSAHGPTRSASSRSRTPGDTLNGSLIRSGSTRREIKMLNETNLSELSTRRHKRRIDPQRGKLPKAQQDYVYYNHRSKGFYVPHDPSPNTIMLHYNHLYSFGDGTRFAASTPPHSDERIHTPGAMTAAHLRNPHAAPPRTFAETRGCAFPYTASQRENAPHYNSAYKDTAQQPSATYRADAQKGSSSLRTGKAVDLTQLHSTQCPRPRTIEEVMADQPQRYLAGSGGLRGALVQDIERDVEVGKLQWNEVPAPMQKAMASVTTTSAAAQRSQHNLTADQKTRAGANQLEPGQKSTASGDVAPKTWSMTPPSSALTAVGRAPNSERTAGSAASSSRRIPIGAATAAVALPAISRLNYTPRATKRLNPSAFV